jgi:predicted phage gp36 major capsid-like protein
MDAMMKFSELDRELAARGTERSAGTLRQTQGRLLERLVCSTRKCRKTIPTSFPARATVIT